jgi:hypothetical protein
MAKNKRIIPLSQVMPSKSVKRDSVKMRHDAFGDKRNADLLQWAAAEYGRLHDLRMEHQRNTDFMNGKQWGDLVQVLDPDTGRIKTVTEGEYIAMQGMKPMEYNLIDRLVTTYVGNWIQQKMEPVAIARDPDEKEGADMLTLALQADWQRSDNDMGAMLPPQLRDAACGGLVAAREVWELTQDGMYDAMTYFINTNRIFFSSNMSDTLLRDLKMVGYFKDMSRNELFAAFAKTKKDEEMLKEEYDMCNQIYPVSGVQVGDENKMWNTYFYTSLDQNSCRVYEIWTLEVRGRYRCWDMMTGSYFICEEENIDRVPLAKYGMTLQQVNEQRVEMGMESGIGIEDIPLIDYGQLGYAEGLGFYHDQYWYVQFLTPRGTILYEGESPYACGCPITLSLYPMSNGEVKPIVSNAIPMQKNLNRSMMLNDLIMKNAAKQTTYVDVKALDDSMRHEEIKFQLTSPNGLIKYNSGKGGDKPSMQQGNPISIGVEGIVSLNIKMMEDALGIHGANQGKEALSGQSAALYQQQQMAGSTMMQPFLNWFETFIRNVAIKKAKFIQQFYEDHRYINVTGDAANGAARYDKEIAGKLEHVISISKASLTAVQTELSNQMAVEMWKAGAFSVKSLLKSVNLPFAAALLKNIEEEEQKMAEAKSQGQQYMPQLDQDIIAAANAQIPQEQQEAALNLMNAEGINYLQTA